MNCHMTEPRSLQNSVLSDTPSNKREQTTKIQKTKQKQIPQKITQPNQTNKVRTKFGSQSQQHYTNRLTDKCS